MSEVDEKRAIKLTRQGWIAAIICCVGMAIIIAFRPPPSGHASALMLVILGSLLFALWRLIKGWVWSLKFPSVLPHTIATTVGIVPPLAAVIWSVKSIFF